MKTTTITGDDGSYYFGGLRVGTYTVTETQPAALLPGGTDTQQVVINGDEPKTGVDFVEGWLRTQINSIAQLLRLRAVAGKRFLHRQNVRKLIARGEQQAGHTAQAAAIRAGGSQTTVFITGTVRRRHHRVHGRTDASQGVCEQLPVCVRRVRKSRSSRSTAAVAATRAQLVGSTSSDVVTLRPSSRIEHIPAARLHAARDRVRGHGRRMSST